MRIMMAARWAAKKEKRKSNRQALVLVLACLRQGRGGETCVGTFWRLWMRRGGRRVTHTKVVKVTVQQ